MSTRKGCLIIAGGTLVGSMALCGFGALALMATSGSTAGSSPSSTSADPLSFLRAELEKELDRIYGAELLSLEVSNRVLTVGADLGPVNSQARLDSTGKILAVIAKHQPPADWIHIETPASQRIRVSMRSLIAYTNGQMDISHFMATWEVTKE